MSVSHATRRHQPAESSESHACCGGDKTRLADRAGPQAEADKPLAGEQPSPKAPEPRRTQGGGCGCGH